MKEHAPEIVVATIGVVSTYVAWLLGGKQNAKNSKDDTLTRGADMIVESSQKLLQTLEKMLEEERQHRQTCEDSMREMKLEIDELRQALKLKK